MTRMSSASRSRRDRLNRSESEMARLCTSPRDAGKQTTHSVACRSMLQGRSIVNITEGVRKYAAEQAIFGKGCGVCAKA